MITAASRCRPGFCATVFADNLGHVRHMTVAPNGVLYVNTWSGRYFHNDTPPAGGFLIALKDSKGDGHADKIERFGAGVPQGSAGGSGIAYYKDAIYAEQNDKIIRYALSSDSIVPNTAPLAIVTGLPLTGDHPMHPFIIDAQGHLYVDLGSATNSCQAENRMPNSPGTIPAPSCRRAPAPGCLTPTRAARNFRRPSATSPACATAKASASIPPDGCSRPSTAAISCRRISPSSTRRSKVRNSRPRNSS